MPTCLQCDLRLFRNVSERSRRSILFRVRDDYYASIGMPQLHVTSFLTHFFEPFVGQSFEDFFAMHDDFFTHYTQKMSSRVWLLRTVLC